MEKVDRFRLVLAFVFGIAAIVLSSYSDHENKSDLE